MSIAELLNYNPWTNLNVNSLKARQTETYLDLKNSSGVFGVNHGTNAFISPAQLLSCSCIILLTGGIITESTSVVLPLSSAISALFTASQLTEAISFSVELLVQAALGPRTLIFGADILNTAVSNDPAFWTNTPTITLVNNTSRRLVFTYYPSRTAWTCFSV